MGLTDREKKELVDSLGELTPAQQEWVKKAIHSFSATTHFWRAPDSDVITESVLNAVGDRLLTHHAASHQPLKKELFEYAFESALNQAGIPANLASSSTNPGHDITIKGVPVSLKTEAARNIRDDFIHVSKWMELGQGKWELPLLRDRFLQHMQGYDRIFTMRRLQVVDGKMRYEFVEIPKELLQEASNCHLEVCSQSRQNPQPGYGYIREANGDLKFSLYFDGGTERKLQIKHLRKDLCKVHATWVFESPTAS